MISHPSLHPLLLQDEGASFLLFPRLPHIPPERGAQGEAEGPPAPPALPPAVGPGTAFSSLTT